MKRNNIYDYFYEVLTNFYDFLMGPHTVSGPLASSWATTWVAWAGQQVLPMSVTARAQIPFIYHFCCFFFLRVKLVRTADCGSRAACLHAHKLRPCWQQMLKIMIYGQGSFGYKIRNGDDKQLGDIRRRNNCFGRFVRPIIKMVALGPVT